jgi:hypothetical protein
MNAVDNSNRLPARLTVYLAVLPRQMMRIVKDQAGRLEADAVLLLVDPVLSFIFFRSSQANSTTAFVMTNMYIQ